MLIRLVASIVFLRAVNLARWRLRQLFRRADSMGDYVVNPSLNVSVTVVLDHPIAGPSTISQMVSPQRGSGGARWDHLRVLFQLLEVAAAKHDERHAKRIIYGMPPELLVAGERQGVIVARGEAPEEVEYKCVLRDPQETSAPSCDDSDLVVNPHIYLQPTTDVPPVVRERIGQRVKVLPPPPTAWVENPRTRILMPVVLDGETRCVVDLVGGRTSMSDLEDAQRRRLQQADILLQANGVATSHARLVADMASALQSDGFAVVRDVFNEQQLAAVKDYIRRLIAGGYLNCKDLQVPGRESRPNEALMQVLHEQLARLVSAATQESLKPSFTLLLHYKEGSVLNRHIDREQCRWNISFALDYGPDADADIWPICVDIHGVAHEVRLRAGDLLLYRGTETPHWRDRLADGRSATVAVFHFVSSSFDGSLD